MAISNITFTCGCTEFRIKPGTSFPDALKLALEHSEFASHVIQVTGVIKPSSNRAERKHQEEISKQVAKRLITQGVRPSNKGKSDYVMVRELDILGERTAKSSTRGMRHPSAKQAEPEVPEPAEVVVQLQEITDEFAAMRARFKRGS